MFIKYSMMEDLTPSSVRELENGIHGVLNDWSLYRTWCDTQGVFARLSIRVSAGQRPLKFLSDSDKVSGGIAERTRKLWRPMHPYCPVNLTQKKEVAAIFWSSLMTPVWK